MSLALFRKLGGSGIISANMSLLLQFPFTFLHFYLVIRFTFANIKQLSYNEVLQKHSSLSLQEHQFRCYVSTFLKTSKFYLQKKQGISRMTIISALHLVSWQFYLYKQSITLKAGELPKSL